MTYEETTGRTIEADFKEFHEKNPIVYALFKRYARELIEIRRGKAIPDKDIRLSSKLIINRIRWEQQISLVRVGKWKINDAFTSMYARQFVEDFPKWGFLFNLRKLRNNRDYKGK